MFSIYEILKHTHTHINSILIEIYEVYTLGDSFPWVSQFLLILQIRQYPWF